MRTSQAGLASHGSVTEIGSGKMPKNPQEKRSNKKQSIFNFQAKSLKSGCHDDLEIIDHRLVFTKIISKVVYAHLMSFNQKGWGKTMS